MASTHHFDATRLFSVKGYVCVVTGGGTGIGLMASQALAANGAKVYITGRRTEVLETAAKEHSPREASETGGQIIPIGPCDVTKKEDLERLVAEVEKREKYISLLVCNAGISGPKAEPESRDATELKKQLWEKESVEQWQETFAGDVTSLYFTTVAFLPLLQAAAKHGKESADPSANSFAASVITISSMSGLIRHAQGHFSYNAAKAGAVHLSKMMSAEFGKTGIRVNSIAPGYFPSEMTAKASDDRNKSEFPEGKIASAGHDVPAERAGRDEEIGMAVLFLAKNEYVNGQILSVDGGVQNVVAA